MSKRTETTGTIDPARRQLEDWPYVPHYLQATLDHELIESHGTAILHRALNLGRVVAFVSSGVSMSYGRLSWSALVQALVEEGRELRGTSPAADGKVIARLKTTLDELRISERTPGDDLQSGRFPAAFQFCEQLWVAHMGQSGRREFRDKVKRLLFDDHGHAKLLLQDLARDIVGLREGSGAAQKADAPGQGTDGMRRKEEAEELSDAIERFFHSEDSTDSRQEGEGEDRSVRRDGGRSEVAPRPPGRESLYDPNGEPLARPWRETLAAGRVRIPDASDALPPRIAPESRHLIDAITSGGTRRGALPTHRFLVTAAARLWVAGSSKAEAVDAFREAMDASNSKRLQEPRIPTDFRAQYVPPELDPLAILSDELRIGRFITTNFDLDIEQLMADRGFTPERRDPEADPGLPMDRRFETVDPLGATAADTVLDVRRAVDLIDFAVNQGHHAYNLIHLHGRDAQGNNLVVTERDYLNLYLGRGPDNDVVSDALEIGFGSNPLLFVGNGMGEDDILRPLRQFVSERSSDTDRQAVALLPALGSKARQIEETIAIYSRYGVHTVHFGFACIEAAPEKRDRTRAANGDEGGEVAESHESPVPVRWLALSLAMAADLRSVFAALDEDLARWPTPDGSAAAATDAKWRDLCRGYDRTRAAEAAHIDDPRHWFDLLEIDTLPASGQHVLRRIMRLEGVPVARGGERALYPDVEIRILEASWMTLRELLGVDDLSDDAAAGRSLPQLRKNPDRWPALRRLASAYRSTLRGLPDALISLSLCAKLNGLRESWMAWKRDWYALPIPRLTGGPYYDETSSPYREKARRVYERHPLALRLAPYAPPPGSERQEPQRQGVPDGDRFFAGGPSKAFSTLFSALRAARAAPNSALNRAPEKAGRRIFVLLGPRGVGKGHFFEALRAKRRLDAFIEASWPEGAAPYYPAVAMLNLGLSMEVTSAFDRISHVLVACARSGTIFQGAEAEEVMAAGKALRRDRIGRLTRVLGLYGEHSEKAKGRILFAASGFNVLFNRGGLPKNGQAARLIEALLGTGSERAPIDVLLICDESGFPSIFRETPSGSDPPSFCSVSSIALESLVRPNIDDRGSRLLDALVAKYRVAISRDQVAPLQTAVAEARRPSAFFHVLHIARASLTVGTYFPTVSLALAAAPGRLSRWDGREAGPAKTIPLPTMADRRLIQDEIVRTLLELEERRGTLVPRPGLEPDERMTEVIPNALVALARELASRDRCPASADFAALVEASFNGAVATVGRPPPGSEAEMLDEDFKYLFHLFDHNRFLLTIACAAGTEITTSEGDDGRFSPRDVIDWFKELARTILGLHAAARAQAVIDHVLRFHGQRHGHKKPLPAHCRIDPEGSDMAALEGSGAMARIVEDWLRGPQGWRLQQSLLWHLAVCSHPIEADVLATAPKIVSALLSLRSGLKRLSAAGDVAEYVVAKALDILVHRCLVFRLWGAVVDSPEARHGEEGRPPPERRGAWRFTLHRLMQSSIYLRLHAPSVEAHVVDQYTLSLYGTLPNDLPRPRAEVIQDLDALISAWTGFPRDSATIDRDNPYHRVTVADQEAAVERSPVPSATLPARLLRAAFGVIRSVYSVSVVSRFDDFSDKDGPPVPVAGYFEQHRLQILWLLRKAVDLSYAQRPIRIFTGENHGKDSGSAPFYAEEIVWLYNECGLLSLIEGRLDDADFLFDCALAAARGIELDAETGPLRVRLTLNSAIVDLERGRVGTARRRFGSVERQVNEHPVIRAVAGGYLGVCAHVNGDLVTARDRYDLAIERLRGSHHARGVAIFSRHLADLFRASGPTAAEHAYRAADQAIAHAQRGGHEDVHQNARLSRVRIDISQLPSTLQTGRIQTELDGIERYGQIMGIPRLACDVAYTRATFLLAIGETQHATTLARRSLRIATQHDLKLRQVSGLALMARIYERRGLAQPAADLFRLAHVFANLCDYRSAHFAASRRSEHDAR